MTINEILEAMENDSLQKTASEVDENGIVSETEKVAEAENYTAEDMEKVAEADAEGRIMARGFWDEFQKIAVALPPEWEYPADPGAIKANQAEVAKGDVVEPGGMPSAKVRGIVNQLATAKMTGNGEVTVNGNPAVEPKKDPQEGNPLLPKDMATAQEREATKLAADGILTNLFNKYCN